MDVATDRRSQEGVTASPLSPERRDERSERAISPRLAPSLSGAGGLLVALGAIGTWLRATSVPAGSGVQEQVSVVTGRSESGGWILLAIGIAAAAAGLAWLARAARLRAVAAAASTIAVVLVAIRLSLIDGRASEMAGEAASTTGIDSFHAGFGWGAWLLLIGAVLLALGLLAGGLRELDLRRGE